MNVLDATTQQIVDTTLNALADLKANDVVTIDVRAITSLADVMVIASGTSTRHVKALANNVSEKVKEAGFRPLGTEGDRDAEWILIDLAGVIVHVMLPATRAFYDLERLWNAPASAQQTARA